MARWEPNAQERLQQAAMALFQERGYADVTVAEIADRAGLTKRTFFNHFADKREVLFAGAQAFEAGIIQHLAEAAGELGAIDAAIDALTRGGLDLARYGDYAHARRELIASSPDLQERNLIKMASLTAAIAAALRARHVPGRTAAFAAQAAVAVFTAAYDDWADDTTADFTALMQRSLSNLRHAICLPQADLDLPDRPGFAVSGLRNTGVISTHGGRAVSLADPGYDSNASRPPPAAASWPCRSKLSSRRSPSRTCGPARPASSCRSGTTASLRSRSLGTGA